MKRLSTILAACVLLMNIAFAKPADESAKDENNRLRSAGTVLQEILGISENIPKDLLDKARGGGVPPGQGFFWSFGGSSHVCARRWKRRFPNRGSGNRLCDPGDELAR